MMKKNEVQRCEVAAAVTRYGRSRHNRLWKAFSFFLGNDLPNKTYIIGLTASECDSFFDPPLNHVQPGLFIPDRRGLIK